MVCYGYLQLQPLRGVCGKASKDIEPQPAKVELVVHSSVQIQSFQIYN